MITKYIKVAKHETHLGINKTPIPCNSLFARFITDSTDITVYTIAIKECFYSIDKFAVYVLDNNTGKFIKRYYNACSGIGLRLKQFLKENYTPKEIDNWKLKANFYKSLKRYTPQPRKISQYIAYAPNQYLRRDGERSYYKITESSPSIQKPFFY